MTEERNFKINFTRILCEEMSKYFDLKPLPLDPDIKIKHFEYKL